MKSLIFTLLIFTLVAQVYFQTANVTEIERLIKNTADNYSPLACFVLASENGQTILKNLRFASKIFLLELKKT